MEAGVEREVCGDVIDRLPLTLLAAVVVKAVSLLLPGPGTGSRARRRPGRRSRRRSRRRRRPRGRIRNLCGSSESVDSVEWGFCFPYRSISHGAKSLTPSGGTPARLWSESVTPGWKEGKSRAYLSLQLPAWPEVPVQRMMMLEVRDGPAQ